MSELPPRPRILYFTESYPFGLGEEWKRVELETFRPFFAQVEVVPLTYGGNTTPKPAISGVTYHPPLFPNGIEMPSRAQQIAAVLAHPQRALFLRELAEHRAFRSRIQLDRWLHASYFMIQLSRHPALRRLLEQDPSNTVLYFFWARGTSEVLPLLDTGPFMRTVLRLHAYDLYKESARGWLPYQGAQLRKATEILPCSQHGSDYLGQLYPRERARIRTALLGSSFHGLSAASDDGILRVVSCSLMVPAKRVHLLVEALALVSHRVEWTHIGDGPLMSELVQKIAGLAERQNVTVRLLGRLAPTDVPKVYTAQPCDLFVNVSEYEGLPVSIVEALAAGIPVLATAVAGTPEIVDGSCGKLLPLDVTPVQLASELDSFAQLDADKRAALRAGAHARFVEGFDAEQNARKLASSLVSRG